MTDTTRQKIVFMTGATGYVGQRLAMRLAHAGHRVHALVRKSTAKEVLDHPNIVLFEGDILQPESIQAAIKGCAQVFHVAALARLVHKDPNEFYRINVAGTENVLKAAVGAGVEKFVLTSTTGVLGPCLNQPMREQDPRIYGYDNHYETSKQLAEMLVEQYNQNGLEALVVMPSRVYGPGISTYSNGVNRFISGYLKKGFSVIPKCPTIAGNYVFLDDVVEGHLLAMQHGKGGERYILGGENVAFGDFTKTIREVAGTGRFVTVPTFLIKATALMAQLKALITRSSPELTPRMVERLFLHCQFSSDKAKSELNYQVTPFREGITKTIAHLKNGTHA